jgi:hypothetical protein
MDDNTRKCIITGKLNIDSLTKKKEKRIRVVAQINEVSHEREKEILDSIINGNVDEYSELAKRSVKAKLNGYKQQDIIKSLYDETLLISLHEIFIKLQKSCLLCFYCDKPVRILYRVVRDPLQWSLDRIDNSKCHSDANTVIACLGCNLKRRVTDQKKFDFTKKLIINKIR